MDSDPSSNTEELEKVGPANKNNTHRKSDSQSDSLSVSTPLLPDNAERNDDLSDCSGISEHLSSNSDCSVENDCSYQEIEISNILSNSPLPLQESSDDEPQNSLQATAEHDVQSVLNEMLQSSAFQSDTENNSSESFNLFEGVNLNDSLINVESIGKSDRNQMKDVCDSGENTKFKRFGESLTSKDDPIPPITRTETESLHEFTPSNQSTLSLNTSTTDYKLWTEEFQNRIVEYQNALADRDSIIQQLTEALQQSVINQERLQSQQFTKEICNATNPKPIKRLEEHYLSLEATLNSSQIDVFKQLRKNVDEYIDHKMLEINTSHQNELKTVEDNLQNEKERHESEIAKLKNLLSNLQCDQTDIVTVREELQTKHSQELEELRTYFEKKCADLEKHYSEEVFSQQSRKLSGSTSSLEMSDLVYSASLHIPGPGGDNECLEDSKVACITKDDLTKLKTALNKINQDLEKYNIEDISKQELCNLRDDIKKHGLANILKFDLMLLKNDMQDKHNAELQILKEDYESKIDALNIENNNYIHNMEKKYVNQIDLLKLELDGTVQNAESNTDAGNQEVVSSGEFEFYDVVQSYEHRLREQVALAKLDIINSLEQQIQMLVANTNEDAEWPTELLRLRTRFTEKFEKEILELEERHKQEMDELKDKQLNNNDDLVKERDDLKKTTHLLRYLIGELMKYFTECENELNKTLVDQLLKNGFDKNLTEIEIELNDSSNSTYSDSGANAKQRVHLTPKFTELLANIDNSISSSMDSSISDLKNELGACLERLRSDANTVLALSSNLNKTESVPQEDDRLTLVTNQLAAENEIKNNLADELKEANRYIKNLEEERTNLENHIQQLIARQKILETDLENARLKIMQLIENGQKEVISAGYGDRNIDNNTPPLSELQERIKNAAMKFGIGAEHPFLQLVDEFCRQSDRTIEETKYTNDDLRQQVEAADKKLKVMNQFLEEQAAEREQERDEAHKEIGSLKDQIREREKDHVNCDLIYTEVEQLEQKMHQMSQLLKQNDERLNGVESEKQEAIDKVFFLRDIIRGLENELETKTQTETKLRDSITQLKDIIQQQNKLNEELGQRLGLLTSTSEAQQYQEHIDHLEDEVERLKINKEFIGSEGALKQIKTQLNEFEMSIDKCTRDLEVLHSAVCTTTCSSPSEDVSIRDQINPSIVDECDIPLQQLARLKEKLIKHSRAEEAAVKRIHDLEMEVCTFQQNLHEMQNERDLLQDQMSEQLVIISSLQMRLDEQRLRAANIQKQTNSSLEARIYDLENEIKDLMELINSKDKTIKQLNKVVDETKTKLQVLEQEIKSNDDYKIIENLRQENASLLSKINKDAQNAQLLPNLVDNILADKNKDIDMLRSKLDKTEAELNIYTSLNFDYEQLKSLSRLQGSDRAFSDILSLIDVQPRKVNKTYESVNASFEILQHKRAQDDSVGVCLAELSSIDKVGEQRNIHYSMDAPLTKPNSTEIKSAEKKKVRFEDYEEITKLRNKLQENENIIADYSERFKALTALEATIEDLKLKLDNTEKALGDATETFEKEQLVLNELRVELAEKKMHLADKEKQLELYIQDATRKDKMFYTLAKEKHELEQQSAELTKHLEAELNEKETLNAKIVTLENADSQLKEHHEINVKLTKDIKNLESQWTLLNKELSVLKQVIEDKNNEIQHLQSNLQIQTASDDKIKELQHIILDRETEIEILNEDTNRYQDDLAKLENKIKTLQNATDSEFEIKLAQTARDVAARDLEITKLKSEVNDYKRNVNMQNELISDQEKVIKQITEDSRILHINLETYQSKFSETGNIVYLKRCLEEEQQTNRQLKNELQKLRSDLEYTTKPVDMTTSIDEITGAVCKQLDYSAHLDGNILNAVGVCGLEEVLEQEKKKNAQLQELLEKQHLKDSETIQKIRLSLEDATKKEVEFKKMLKQEKQVRHVLEQQLKEHKYIRKSLNKGNTGTDYSSLPNLNTQERMKLTKEVEMLLEENKRLKDEVRNFKNAKVESDANAKHINNMAQLSNEIGKLKKQIQEIRRSEANTREMLFKCKSDLENKSSEVENSRIFIDELELEKRQMKAEIKQLRTSLTKMVGKESGTNSRAASEELLSTQVKELTKHNDSLVQENRRFIKTIKKSSDEINLLQQRISELQEMNNGNLVMDDQTARANHLFARYLRSESYRKALIFQKHYLVGLLATYQLRPAIPQGLKFQTRKRKLISFRIVAVTVMSVVRMQYLVQRWNTGKRNYHSPLRLQIPQPLGRFNLEDPIIDPSKSRTHSTRTINNPASNFSQIGCAAGTSNKRNEMPRAQTPPDLRLTGSVSGDTPPTRDVEFRLHAPDRGQRHNLVPNEPQPAFQVPHLLNQYQQYLEKCNEIQHRLGKTIDKYS